jgi:hypothetical protein
MEPPTALTHTSPIHQTQRHQELRSRILLQYTILRDNQDYVYNPPALSDYLSYDPWNELARA